MQSFNKDPHKPYEHRIAPCTVSSERPAPVRYRFTSADQTTPQRHGPRNLRITPERSPQCAHTEAGGSRPCSRGDVGNRSFSTEGPGGEGRGGAPPLGASRSRGAAALRATSAGTTRAAAPNAGSAAAMR